MQESKFQFWRIFMSKKKFLAKMCLASLLFGGNCNANPPKIAEFFWGQNIEKTAENLIGLNGTGQPQINEIKYLVVKPDGVDCCTVTIDDAWFKSEECERLSKVVGETFDGKCNYCYDEFLESEETCIKLNSRVDNCNCDHLLHSNCFKRYGESKKGVCPMDQKKVERVYILLENGQDFEDDNVKRIVEDIKTMISKDDDHDIDFHGLRGIVRLFNNNPGILYNLQAQQLVNRGLIEKQKLILILVSSIVGGCLGVGSRLAAARILGNQAGLRTLIRNWWNHLSPNREDGLVVLFVIVGTAIYSAIVYICARNFYDH